MDLSKISQSHIKQNIAKSKKYMTKQDIADCKDGLKNVDFGAGNRDGKVTGIEMYKSWSRTCKNIFAGNEEFLKRGEEISQAQGEIYSLYAGDDGVLDVYEYNAALQSDEMGALIDEYWDMKHEMQAMNGNVDEAILARFDMTGNNDGKVSAEDVQKFKTDTYSKKYEGKKLFKSLSENIIRKQAEILKKFQGDDGVLSSEEYINAVNSSEYQATVNKLNLLDTVFNFFN